MTCRHCHFSEYHQRHGLWCRILKNVADKRCGMFLREPGADDDL